MTAATSRTRMAAVRIISDILGRFAPDERVRILKEVLALYHVSQVTGDD